MSTATIVPIQLPLFDLEAQYTAADRMADRKLCFAYLKQWAGSFRSESITTVVSVADFRDAATRLA